MIGAGRVLADVFGAAELLKIQDLPSVDWSSMLTLAYPTTAMIRSMLKVWQVDLQPWSRPVPDDSLGKGGCRIPRIAGLSRKTAAIGRF